MATNTKTRTPAEIPAETTAAHQTEFEPLLPLVEIHPHPNNIRHDATADHELVESIRTQGLIEPLVVAPHPDDQVGGFILIGGHRRLDGLHKAGHTSAPALVRLDLTEVADQVAAMLVENGRRKDLTLIEEAEGFDLLAELGWKAEDIAAATGYSKTTVTKRRKLTGLRPTFQEQVAAGQVTIDDAIDIASLPEKEQARLAGVTPSSLAYELNRSRERIRQQREVDTEIRDLKKRGATEVKLPAGVYYYELNDADHGLTRLSSLPGNLAAEAGHDDACLSWIDTGTAQYPSIGLVCRNVSRHDDEIAAHHAARAAEQSEADKAREEERAALAAEHEAEQAERAEREEARRVAARMRGDVVMAAAGKVKPPDVLVPVLRMVTIGMLNDFPLAERLMQDLAKVPDEQRWKSFYEREAFEQTVAGMAPVDLWRTFVACLVAHLENDLDYLLDDGEPNRGETDAAIFREYLAVLQAAGHELTPPDEDLAAILDPATDEAEAS